MQHSSPTFEQLDIEEIESNIAGYHGKITYFDTIDSTNEWLMKHGNCADICLSEAQTAGKGRRGNQWTSPPQGNIYFSMCWCFEEIPEHWSLLGLVTGIAVSDALYEIGLRQHGIKWPNDIFWKQQKLGGILLESQNQSGRIVAGIGLNVNMQNDPDINISQPWVNLRNAMNDKPISRNLLVTKIIENLSRSYTEFSSLDLNDFHKNWQHLDILNGRTVSFENNNKKKVGKVMGIDDQGRIAIHQQNGSTAYFASAEIKLVPHEND